MATSHIQYKQVSYVSLTMTSVKSKNKYELIDRDADFDLNSHYYARVVNASVCAARWVCWPCSL